MSASVGSYVKCLRNQAADPEIVRVKDYIGEPTYILVDDAGKEFPCPNSLVDFLSPDEEINYWKLRAHAAEMRATIGKEILTTTLDAVQKFDEKNTQPVMELPMGVKNENGFLIAHCNECKDYEELDAMTAAAAEQEIVTMGWRKDERGLTCAFCLEKEANGLSDQEPAQD